MTSDAALAVLVHARRDIRSVADELIRMATVAHVAGDHRQRDTYLSQAEALIRFAAGATLERYGAYAITAFSVQPPAADDG